eukprot:scaffold1189_cov194-Amphora_coffeaeformis.AAC.1
MWRRLRRQQKKASDDSDDDDVSSLCRKREPPHRLQGFLVFFLVENLAWAQGLSPRNSEDPYSNPSGNCRAA